MRRRRLPNLGLTPNCIDTVALCRKHLIKSVDEQRRKEQRRLAQGREKAE